jgi:hypothetical protein
MILNPKTGFRREQTGLFKQMQGASAMPTSAWRMTRSGMLPAVRALTIFGHA